MSSAAEILVVILAAALAIFITLGIILFILLIRLTKQIGDATTNMNDILSNVDELVKNITMISSPFIIGKGIMDFFKNIKKKENNKDE